MTLAVDHERSVWEGGAGSFQMLRKIKLTRDFGVLVFNREVRKASEKGGAGGEEWSSYCAGREHSTGRECRGAGEATLFLALLGSPAGPMKLLWDREQEARMQLVT